MRAEDTLQYMADFYPELFPTRKHALNHLFCVLGNGYEWINGELVDDDNEYEKRYKLRNHIKRAEFSMKKTGINKINFIEIYMKEKKTKYLGNIILSGIHYVRIGQNCIIILMTLSQTGKNY